MALISQVFGHYILWFGRAGSSMINTGKNRLLWDVRQSSEPKGVLFSVSKSLPRILVNLPLLIWVSLASKW